MSQQLSVEHKPEAPTEIERIKASNGWLKPDSDMSSTRVSDSDLHDAFVRDWISKLECRTGRSSQPQDLSSRPELTRTQSAA